jgi:hypothetical protein
VILRAALFLAPLAAQAAAQGTAAPAMLAAPAAAEGPWDRLSFYAAGRLRAESTFDPASGEDRHRGRMRLRVGGEYRLRDDLRAEARLSTASDGNDANNPHWDFGDGADGFQGAGVVLDRFYVNWDARADLSLQAGKFGHVFARPPVFGELAWDDDVQPAGGALFWSPKKGGDLELDVCLAGYVAVENGSDQDPAMLGAQANVKLHPTEESQLQLASGLMDWGNLSAGSGVPGNQGNTTDEFSVWQSFASGSLKTERLGSATLFVEFPKNLDDDSGEDQGSGFGVQVGRSGKEGDLNAFAALYDLDANAVFSAVAEDDTPIAGTGTGQGMKGAIVGTQYFLMENLSFKLWYLSSDDESEEPYRIRFDLDFRVI